MRQTPRPRFLPRLETLEDRCVLSVVPTWELSEGNASEWTTFAEGASASVVNDTTRVASGDQSLRFVTESGFDTGVRLTSGADTWDLTSFGQLGFWTFSVNDTPIGFQGNQPVVVLESATGSYRYTPVGQDMPNHGWKKHHVPLDGDAFWQRETIGTPDLENITALEIHQDTWDFAFTVYYDGVQFSTRAVSDPPADGPEPPAGVTEGLVAPKLLLYVFDPVMENHGGQRLHQVYGWADPVTLTQQALADFAASSHGLYQPVIVQTVIADQHPYFADSFQHTDASFDQAWADRDFHDGVTFDYARFIEENDLAARVDRGDIDEVWIYSPPIGGMYESVMAGEGAYWINGPTQQAGERVFPIMGLNYERGVGEAIHSFGHRVENTIAHAYESIGGDANNAWRRFTRIDRDAPGQGGVGNVHFPVNGTGDYDYDNLTVVTSNADDWYNYPNFTGATQSVNSETWTPNHEDPQREYLNWWYDHMPHFAGRGPDGRLMNWWRYIGDLDASKYATSGLYGSDGTGKVWLTGIEAGVTVSGVVNVTGSALIDGVVGRMDLYVDGVYHSSDTIGPFTFSWDATGLAAGNHTLQVRAYDAQNGTESVSPTVTVVIGPVNAAPQLTIEKPAVRMRRNSKLRFTGAREVRVADADAGTGIIRLTLAVQGGSNKGTFSISDTTGLSSVTGNKTAKLVLDGTIDAINAALTRVTFRPKRGYVGPATIKVTADDRGLTGAGGIKKDIEKISLTIL